MVRPRECLLVNWIAYEFVRAQNYLIYFKFPVAQSYPGKEHLKKNSKSLSICLPDRMAMAFPFSHCWPVVGSVALKYSHGHEHLLWKGKKEKKKKQKEGNGSNTKTTSAFIWQDWGTQTGLATDLTKPNWFVFFWQKTQSQALHVCRPNLPQILILGCACLELVRFLRGTEVQVWAKALGWFLKEAWTKGLKVAQ